MQPKTDGDYQKLLSEVIKKQIIILGPDITLVKARNVPELTIANDGTVMSISGDPQVVTQKLIEQFMDLSGLIVRKTMEPLLAHYPGIATQTIQNHDVVNQVQMNPISQSIQQPQKSPVLPQTPTPQIQKPTVEPVTQQPQPTLIQPVEPTPAPIGQPVVEPTIQPQPTPPPVNQTTEQIPSAEIPLSSVADSKSV